MIQVKPMENREEENRLLAEADAAEESRVLLMEDRGEKVGYVVVRLEGSTLHLHKLQAFGYDGSERPQGETLFILDTLMRSAASYGENNGADWIITDFPDFYDFFRARGFTIEDGFASTPMSTIVRYEG